jgi:hypothetical protein
MWRQQILKQGCTQAGGGGEAAGLQPPPKTTQNWKLKNKDFVDIMVSKILRHFPFSRNQPLKSADD